MVSQINLEVRIVISLICRISVIRKKKRRGKPLIRRLLKL